METGQIAVAAAGLLLAGLVKGVTGIGYATCALPFLALAVGHSAALGVLLAPTLASNLMLMRGAGAIRETWLRFWPLYVAALPGTALGAWLFARSEAGISVRLLGLVVVLNALFGIVRPDLRLPRRFADRLRAVVGFSTGLLSGLTGSQVLPLMPYMLALELDATRLVQAVNMAVTAGVIFLGCSMAVAGSLPADVLLASGLAVIPASLGTIVGNALRMQLPERAVRRSALVVTLVIGMTMLMA